MGTVSKRAKWIGWAFILGLWVIALVLLAPNLITLSKPSLITKSEECSKRLRSIYVSLKSVAGQDMRAWHISPGKAESPLKLPALERANIFCPVLDAFGRRAPYYLVYSFKERSSSNWSDLSFNKNIDIPFLVDSESFCHGSTFGVGWICYPDGSVKKGFLPFMLKTTEVDNEFLLDVLEVWLPSDDDRFPFGKRYERLRMQRIK